MLWPRAKIYVRCIPSADCYAVSYWETHRKASFSVFAQISAPAVNDNTLDALELRSSSHQAAPHGVLAVCE